MCRKFGGGSLTSAIRFKHSPTTPPPLPSQEYNICFTTIARPTPNNDGTFPLAIPPPASIETGVLPKLIGNLVARRREVKNLLKGESNPARRAQLDIRQKASARSRERGLGLGGNRGEWGGC